MSESFTFGFESNEKELLFGEILHLQTALEGLGLESSLAFGIDERSDLEQLQAAKQLIQDELDEADRLEDIEQRRLECGACHIGPYANGICTICGGYEPK